MYNDRFISQYSSSFFVPKVGNPLIIALFSMLPIQHKNKITTLAVVGIKTKCYRETKKRYKTCSIYFHTVLFYKFNNILQIRFSKVI